MSFGFTRRIPKAVYAKALAKVRQENRTFKKSKRGGWSVKSKGSKTYATNRDRAVVEFYRLQNMKVAKPITGYMKGDKITNFTGLRMCSIIRRSGKGITARCVNGHTYVGRSNGEGMWINLRPKRGR
jgi:hypothetical protein